MIAAGIEVTEGNISHIWNDGAETKPASCTEKGEKTFTCTIEGCGATKTEEIELLSHTSVTDAAVAPTCTETGLTEGAHCSVCATILTEQTTVDALGHTSVTDAAVAPTCTETGLTEGAHCSVCATILTEQTTVDALGHTSVTDAAVAPTCTETGLTEGAHCSVCATILTEQTTVDALGHSYVYAANRNVITETCANGCDHSATATITAEGGRENGSDYTAKVAYSDDWTGSKDTEIVYTLDGKTVTATRSAGDYTASLTIGEATANATFTVTRRRISSSGNSSGGITTIVRPNDTVEIDGPDVPLADADSVIGAGSAADFTDVQNGDWYYDAIDYVCNKKLMNGLAADLFGVNEATTRGMIVTILHRLEGEPTATPAGFTDVAPGKYYANAIAWAAENGIVEGFDSTTFAPDNNITREQFAAILYRYAAYKGYNVEQRADLTGYADAEQISAYAVEAMQWAAAEKLISGMTETTLVPNGDAVRAQAATILARFCENIAK
uniref:SLH domain-containing protein n=1 Tax=uncultured Bacillota bacterium TaxID=344338 RepID=A0A650EQ15_9FIRM|nr:hypothetical protein Firmicute1046_1000 [uncultured Firmicutes bacterium]